MQFVANLRTQTIEAFQEQDVLPAAFLLSAHRATPSAVKQARQLRQIGIQIFADNGTKQLIDLVINSFQDEAAAISDQLRHIRRCISRTPRGRDIPAALHWQASDLAKRVVAQCTSLSESIQPLELLDTQLQMTPTHLFAQEDFAVTCLTALGLERELTGWDITAYNRRNRRSLKLYKWVRSDPRCKDIKVYAVLSGADYNTARAAGRLAAEAHVQHVAFGAASITLDSSAVDFFVLGRGSHQLKLSVPRRYIRLAQVVRGIVDGYKDRRSCPESLHALGLGNPFMFPVLAAGAQGVTTITTDATSPIMDAVRDKVVYDPDRNGDRLSQIEIINQIISGRNWSFTCPFCLAFRNQFGHSQDSAIQWFESQGRPPITKTLLETMTPLAMAIPLFASPRGTDLARRAENTHIAHNHFVLNQLAKKYTDGPGGKDFALCKLEELLEQTLSITTTRGLQVARQVLSFGLQ